MPTPTRLTSIDTIPADSLYAIEGLGQTSLGTNWGDGLATNPAYLSGTSASDPSPFFQQLMTKPFK